MSHSGGGNMSAVVRWSLIAATQALVTQGWVTSVMSAIRMLSSCCIAWPRARLWSHISHDEWYWHPLDSHHFTRLGTITYWISIDFESLLWNWTSWSIHGVNTLECHYVSIWDRGSECILRVKCLDVTVITSEPRICQHLAPAPDLETLSPVLPPGPGEGDLSD